MTVRIILTQLVLGTLKQHTSSSRMDWPSPSPDHDTIEYHAAAGLPSSLQDTSKKCLCNSGCL